MWRQGVGTDEERPDKIGVMLQPTREFVPGVVGAGGHGEFGISAHGVVPEVFDDPHVLEFLERVSEGRVVYALFQNQEGTGAKYYATDPKKVEALQEALKVQEKPTSGRTLSALLMAAAIGQGR